MSTRSLYFQAIANAVRQGTGCDAAGDAVDAMRKSLDTIDANIQILAGSVTAITPPAAAEPIEDVPTGENATDADNATAINAILAAIRTHGIILPTPEPEE